MKNIQAMKNYNNRGFTLVELSIVLVIIGLLIGGILVAQSLIETATLNRFYSEINKYRTAVILFEERYNSYPGDTLILPNPGDGDGKLLSSAESTRAWQHMQQTGFLDDLDTYTGVLGAGYQPGVNIPRSMLYDNGGYHLSTFDNSWMAPSFRDGNPKLLFFSDLRPTFPTGKVISPARAFSIDAKFDDGNALTGDIGTAQGANSGGGGAGFCSPGQFGGSGEYYATEEEIKCYMFFKVVY